MPWTPQLQMMNLALRFIIFAISEIFVSWERKLWFWKELLHHLFCLRTDRHPRKKVIEGMICTRYEIKPWIMFLMILV